MLGSEHFITQILWDNLFRKSQCFYLNIAGTLDPSPTGLWYTHLASISQSLEQWSSLFFADLASSQHQRVREHIQTTVPSLL